jgi:ABC-type multidrug transport system fused ATPase/permease subunit
MKRMVYVKFKSSLIGRSVSILNRSDRRKLFVLAVTQVVLTGLDLIGIGLIGVLGSLAITGVESGKPGNRVFSALKLLHLENLTLQKQATVIGLLAATLLISKTLLSIQFSRKTLFFLSLRGALIANNIIFKLLRESILVINRSASQETLYIVTRGVDNVTNGILATLVSLISDGALLLVIVAGLFAVDPILAISTLLIFGIIAWLLYFTLRNRALGLGNESAKLGVMFNEKMIEVLNSYRESLVRNTQSNYSDVLTSMRFSSAGINAKLAFLPSVGKYVMESVVVLGSLFVAAIQFTRQDAAHAVATIAVFTAASSRVAPALLRIQQGALQFRSGRAGAVMALDLLQELSKNDMKYDEKVLATPSESEFLPEFSILDTSFRYPGVAQNALTNVNIVGKRGEIIALVGPSGAGKTTLVDVLLGILTPSSGSAKISGVPASECAKLWPGMIAYVPQNVYIMNGTIRENLALGFNSEVFSEKVLWDSLEVAQLKDFVLQLPNQLEHLVGENGSSLSGGQRQRIGIARALVTTPKLLVLDESTSSLDGETELNLSLAIQGLKGDVTVVIVAHRLSTVRSADKVIYLNDGHLVSQGTFEEVRRAVPDFDAQAKLMGL